MLTPPCMQFTFQLEITIKEVDSLASIRAKNEVS